MIEGDSILQQIIKQKKLDLADRKKALSPQALLPLVRELPPARGVIAALRAAAGKPAVVAEIKKASPGSGLLRMQFEPAVLARELEDAGVAALSIVTDRSFFQGDLEMVRQMRPATGLPILQHDFVIDAYQLYEARYLGADGLVLTAGLLSNRDMTDFKRYGALLGLDLLVAVRTRGELEQAVGLGFPLIGIENRDPRTFIADLNTTATLIQHVVTAAERPLIVAMGGIASAADARRMLDSGADALLVGEAFMHSQDLAATYRALFEPN